MKRPRYLHRPVPVRCNGGTYRFVTIGYLAHATNRTTRTIKRWQSMGLFPKPEYFLYPNEGPAQRGLYPEEFVDALYEIVAGGHLGRRLDWWYLDRFTDDVWDAYEWAMEPVRGATP
jgi:hypothetical protein